MKALITRKVGMTSTIAEDGVVTAAEAADALAIAKTARGDVTTATLNANVINTAATADAAKALVVAITGGQAAVTAFDNALAAQKAVTRITQFITMND